MSSISSFRWFAGFMSEGVSPMSLGDIRDTRYSASMLIMADVAHCASDRVINWGSSFVAPEKIIA